MSDPLASPEPFAHINTASAAVAAAAKTLPTVIEEDSVEPEPSDANTRSARKNSGLARQESERKDSGESSGTASTDETTQISSARSSFEHCDGEEKGVISEEEQAAAAVPKSAAAASSAPLSASAS